MKAKGIMAAAIVHMVAVAAAFCQQVLAGDPVRPLSPRTYSGNVTESPIAISADGFQKMRGYETLGLQYLTVAGQHLYGISTTGTQKKIYKLNLMDGHKTDSSLFALESVAGMIYSDGELFVGGNNGRLQVFDTALRALGFIRIDGKFGNIFPYEGALYGGSYSYAIWWIDSLQKEVPKISGRLSCFSRSNGYDATLQWMSPMQWMSEVNVGFGAGKDVAIDGYIYVAGMDGKLYAFDAKTGKVQGEPVPIWNEEIDLSRQYSIFYNARFRRLLICDHNGSCTIYSVRISADGSLEASSRTKTSLAIQAVKNAAVYDDRLYVSFDGSSELYVLDAETLDVRRHFNVGGDIGAMLVCTAYATADNGQTVYIYAGLKSGDIVCVKDGESAESPAEIFRHSEDQQTAVSQMTVGEDGSLYVFGTQDMRRFVDIRPAELAVSEVLLGNDRVKLRIGEAFALQMRVIPLAASNRNVLWSSSSESVTRVSAEGVVTAVSAGEAVITVTTEDGNHTAECAVEVLPMPVSGLMLDKSEAELEVGKGLLLTASLLPAMASNKKVYWSSLAEAVATVSPEGIVTALAAGNTVITATSEDGGFSAACALTVIPAAVTGVSVSLAEATLQEGESLALTAEVTPSYAENQQVNWTSSTPGVATVDEKGTVTAIAVGETEISVSTEEGGFTDVCRLQVTPRQIPVTGIKLDSTTFSLSPGETFRLTATVIPENATDKNLRWTTSNETVALVSVTGVVTALTEGEAEIRATTADDLCTASCKVSVVAASVANGSHIRCEVSFYPNPATETVYAKGEYELLQVYDLTGRLQDTYRGEKRIEVRDWRPGVYFFHVTDRRGGTAVYKIVIR